MKCPCCKNGIKKTDIKDSKRGILTPSIKCPHCNTWLKKDMISTSAQLIGVILWFIGIFSFSLSLSKTAEDYFTFGGMAIFLVSFALSRWKVASENE